MGKKKVVEKQDPKSEPKLELGRGKKQCECGEVVGVRTRVCPACQKEFPAPKTTTVRKSGGSLKEQLEGRLEELEELLTSKEKWEEEKVRIEALLEAIGD